MKITGYLSYFYGIIIHPKSTIKSLIEDPNRLRVGFFAVLLLGVLYTANYYIGYMNGHYPASFEPFLRLPTEGYYLYNALFNLPISILSWLLFGCTIYLSIPQNDVRFEDTLAVLGLPYGILILPLMWVPEIVMTIGWPNWYYESWWMQLTVIRVVLGTVWMYVGCTIAVRELYKVSLPRSLFHTIIGVIVALVISLIFLR